jgi:hypothetical protein
MQYLISYISTPFCKNQLKINPMVEKFEKGQLFFDIETKEVCLLDEIERIDGKIRYVFFREPRKIRGDIYYTGSPVWLSEEELSDLYHLKNLTL